MSKKINIQSPNRDKAEQWVTTREITNNQPSNNDNVEIKRMTVDIPKELHMRIKIYCAKNGLKMNEAILPLLESKFSDEG